jgi:hypothetical protein
MAPPVKKTNLLDRIYRDMQRAGYQARTAQSRMWLQGLSKGLKPNRNRLMSNQSSTTQLLADVRSGFMYHFYYNPKTKEKLPYYDRFPLIVMVQRAKGGFYGINLHYLAPMRRAYLLSQLESIASNKLWNDNTKLNISYNILKSFAKFSDFRPCFKRYLHNHVESGFLFVPSSHWDIACFLPTQKFEKKTAQYVWRQA